MSGRSVVWISNSRNGIVSNVTQTGGGVAVRIEDSTNISVTTVRTRGAEGAVEANNVTNLRVDDVQADDVPVVDAAALVRRASNPPELRAMRSDAIAAIRESASPVEAIERVKQSAFGRWAAQQRGVEWAALTVALAALATG